ncbi:MAG: hypothetical protein MH252_01645 [Thermosynechococcaceae cyanobacterium MS004]|nr:hypothetical protein [Thermosynechococcaceae cyanobacterium MS004]
MRRVWITLGLLMLLLWGGFTPRNAAQAGALQARLDQFPHWRSPPSLPAAQGDLYYPDWLAGEWTVTSTLIEIAAPLAPDLVTPGFESNRKQLGKGITFPVRFLPAKPTAPWPQSPFPIGLAAQGIVADRVYNGTSLTEALMGKDVLESIQVGRSPNRQVARFRNGQELVTKISDRATETSEEGTFISSELYQQEFRRDAQIYFNQVENTIAYRRVSVNPPQVTANQVTAIYLSPQDPDYFKARQQPVALYRYEMQFMPVLNPAEKL